MKSVKASNAALLPATAFAADRKTLTVAVVNPTEPDRQLNATFSGVTLQAKVRLWQIAPANLLVQMKLASRWLWTSSRAV